MSHIRNRAIDGLSAGDVLTVTRTFSEKDTIQFGIITRDYNPVHYDNRFSGVKGFRNRICHGLLAASIITEIGGQIGWLASGMNIRFIKPVYFGDTVTCSLTINSVEENGRAHAEAVYLNQHNETIMTAELLGFLPGETEREVMQMMVAEGDLTNGVK